MKVRANKIPDEVDYLTAGKVYEATKLKSVYYTIINDKGGNSMINAGNDGCFQLDGGKWEIVESD